MIIETHILKMSAAFFMFYINKKCDVSKY